MLGILRKFGTSCGKCGDARGIFGTRAQITLLTAAVDKCGKLYSAFAIERADTLYAAYLMRRNARKVAIFRDDPLVCFKISLHRIAVEKRTALAFVDKPSHSGNIVFGTRFVVREHYAHKGGAVFKRVFESRLVETAVFSGDIYNLPALRFERFYRV